MSVFALCAVLTVSAFADTETAEYSIHADSRSNITAYNDFVLQPAVSKSVSEYEMIKELRQYPTDTLKENGFSQKEITAIKGPLKAKSKYGNITYTINYDKMYQKNGETFLRTKMTWDWNILIKKSPYQGQLQHRGVCAKSSSKLALHQIMGIPFFHVLHRYLLVALLQSVSHPKRDVNTGTRHT